MKKNLSTPPLKSEYQPWSDLARSDAKALSDQAVNKFGGFFEKTGRNLTNLKVTLGMAASVLTSGNFGLLRYEDRHFNALMQDIDSNYNYEKQGDIYAKTTESSSYDPMLVLPRLEQRQKINDSVSAEWKARSGWVVDKNTGKKDRRDSWRERLWRMRSVGFHALKAYTGYRKDVLLGKSPVSLIDDEAILEKDYLKRKRGDYLQDESTDSSVASSEKASTPPEERGEFISSYVPYSDKSKDGEDILSWMPSRPDVEIQIKMSNESTHKQ